MEWDKDALEAVEKIPLPPMIAHYAKLDAERRAKKKGLNRVTIKEVEETDRGYDHTFGKEAMDTLRAITRGEGTGPEMPEDFFVQELDQLYTIEICPAKYGASTKEKREHILKLMTPLRSKLKELNVTDLMMDLATTSLSAHHNFRIGITGCPNACFSPYFMDFGILGVYQPVVRDSGCTECGKCVEHCSLKAISLKDGKPIIDSTKCIKCAGCTEVCEEGVITTGKKGYKVVVGGSGARRPKIAETATEMTDLPGVLKILEKCIETAREMAQKGSVFSFHEIVDTGGVEKFKL